MKELNEICYRRATSRNTNDYWFHFTTNPEQKKLVIEIVTMPYREREKYLDANPDLPTPVVEELWNTLEEREQRHVLGSQNICQADGWAEGHIFNCHEVDVWLAMVDTVSDEFLMTNWFRIFADRGPIRVARLTEEWIEKHVNDFSTEQWIQMISERENCDLLLPDSIINLRVHKNEQRR